MISTPPRASEVQEFTSATERIAGCLLSTAAVGFIALSVYIGTIVAHLVS